MSETKEFHIGDILSVVTGRLVSLDHIGGVYNILNWMTGEDLMTHQLPRVSEECGPSLREQFPDLAAVEVPDTIDSEATLLTWLASLKPQYGETRAVARLAAEDHTRINPLAEIAMMRPDLPIISIEVPRGE